MPHQDEPLPVTSSTEPDWPPAAIDCYRDVLHTLNAASVPYAVGGTFAMHAHTGIWKATKDLDVMLTAAHIPRALEALRQAGFAAYVADPVWLAKVERGEHFVDLITGLGNAGLVIDQDWIDRATPANILGLDCKVLRAEEMIASKLFVSHRERFDGADVAHLILKCGAGLDWHRLLELIDEHWELLLWALVFFAYIYPARTQVVPAFVWTGLTQRFAEQVRQPRPDLPFRGSLIDPNMFAIDVAEWGERNLYREYCDNHPCLLDTDQPTGSAR